MSSLQKATLEEIREAASRLCRDYLTGRWKTVSAEQLIVKRISGGLSNFLYYISLPEIENCSNISLGDKNSNASDVAQLESTATETILATTTTITSPAATVTATATTTPTALTLTKANVESSVNKRQRTHSACDNGNSIIALTQSYQNQHHQQQQQHPTEPQEVLLRIYGQIHGDDALESMITESVVFALLSERNFGPKLHGVFPGGRIEQYIKARPLTTIELSDQRISTKIAEKMGEIHSLNIPMSKEPDWLWNCMERWLSTIGNMINRTDWKDVDEELLRTVRSFDYNTEAKWLKSIIDLGNYTVLFCHNDMQEGNILLRENGVDCTMQTARDSLSSLRTNMEDSAISGLLDDVNNSVMDTRKRCIANNNNSVQSTDLDCTHDSALSGNSDDYSPDLIIIDFEYCAYNYRGFDLANHFIEWTIDYSIPTFPFFGFYKHQYPTLQQRLDFMTVYLKKLHEHVDGYVPSVEELNSLQHEVEVFSLFSHLFWSLWSAVNVSSNIEFGYWDYAVLRINEYLRLKQAFLAEQTVQK